MGKRGPKPKVDASRLRTEAARWALTLFLLRDGKPGAIFLAPVKGLPEGWDEKLLGAVYHPKAVAVIPANLEERKIEGLRKNLAPGATLVLREPPQPEIWKQLKRARTAPEMRAAADSVEAWEDARVRNQPPEVAAELAQIPAQWKTPPRYYSAVIREHASALVRVKRLPHYPAEAASNDDKRIVFFAKVLAGLALGLAPLTATKRLSRFDLRGWKPGTEVAAWANAYPIPEQGKRL